MTAREQRLRADGIATDHADAPRREPRATTGPGLVEPARLRAALRNSVHPPIRRREFWLTQLFVLVIAIGHSYLEYRGGMEALGPLDFLPITLFLFPVVYAGLNFGLAGAAPTALWCAVISVPNITLWHQGFEMIAETWQAGLVVFVGLFVGERIDRERLAREEAEQREDALRRSETKYRGLFGAIPDPILLVDAADGVTEGNHAAAHLFGLDQHALRGLPVADLVGPELGPVVTGKAPPRVGRLAADNGRAVRWVEPLIATVGGEDGQRQIVLHDVTLQRERQEGLETYTRRTLSTREEERRGIARDLHDGPLQTTVVLARELDSLEAAVPPSAARGLADARALADEIADELRRFSRELRPSILDDLGLASAVRSEVNLIAARSALSVRYGERGQARRLAAETELMLFRILQEALRNVERHSGAASIQVRLSFGPDTVRLVVADDGEGIRRDTETIGLLSDGKLGLVGMRERARLAGGDVTIRNRRARGTVVCAWLPVAPPDGRAS